ncbi:NAD-dependent epimerase/dehydratase family protein [Bacillus alkalicellulosilyticus]|uniref:NAD-dependent epimerase/dehydratase family protein n=1 Tax=Alkalihalobacterium alkalicellulosilyticum TaxID=1912214 RepID=UPI0014838111|nr:NAD-dependent epimerase/dehydratase family protein [Bacillus alkalicellulosilyticus]
MKKQLLIVDPIGDISLRFCQLENVLTTFDVTVVVASENEVKVSTGKGTRLITFVGKSDFTKLVFDRDYDIIIHISPEKEEMEKDYFILWNIDITFRLLEKVRERKATKFIYVSSALSYGPLKEDDVPFTEETILNPSSPVAASIASGELFTQGFYHAYNCPVCVVRRSSVYGPSQHHNCLSTIIESAFTKSEVQVYGDGKHMRDWLYIDDFCQALIRIIDEGKIGEVYNVGGGHERAIMDVTKLILDYIDKPHNVIRLIEDQKIHERRYALNWQKVQEHINWKPTVTFYDGLIKTIKYYEDKLQCVQK